MTDRDALIERLTAFADVNSMLMNPYVDHAGFALLSKLKADLRALISLASPPPAGPEDVVERVRKAYAEAISEKGGYEDSRIMEIGFHAGYRAALATLPPPEDERVKGLTDALADIRDNGTTNWAGWSSFRAGTALASYRGGA